MPEVAQATITVTPVLEGAQQTLTEELTNAAGPAGTAAGNTAGQNFGTSLGKGMTKAGGALTKGVTAPIMAVGAAAVASWKDVDAGLDTIVEKTGASGAELDSMHQILNNIATSIPTDFETAGAAIGEVNTRFGLTGDNLEDLSAQFVKFAKLNNQDVSSSVDSVSKMMAAFGMSAEEAGTMLDALNVVGQQTGVDVGYLSETVAANAAQLREMGLTAEDSVSLLGEMSMAGLDSSTAMMGMKTAMKNATDEGVTLSDKLSEFEGVMNSNATESDKLAAAYETFGTRAGAAIYNAVTNGTLDLENFSSSLGDFEGSVSGTFENTIGPMDQFQTTLNDLKIAGADLVEAAGPALSEFLGGAADLIGRVTEAWQGLSPEMQQFIIKAAGIAAVIGPLLAIGGTVIGVIGKLVGGIGGLVGGIGGIGGAAETAAGPVATAGGSFASMAGSALQLVALAGSIWITAQAISTIADAAIEVSEGGGPAIAVFFGMAGAIAALMGVAAALGPMLSAGAIGFVTFGAAMLGIGAGIDLACQGISAIIDSIANLTEVIATNADGINSVVTNLGETFGGVVTDISEGVATIVDSIGGAISGVLDSIAGIIDSIGNAALNAGTGFDMLADAVIRLVNDTGVFDLGATLGAVAKGVGDISKEASNVGDSASDINTLTASIKVLGTSTDTTRASFNTFGTQAVSKIKNVGAAFNSLNLGGKMSSQMSSAINEANSGISTLKSVFSSTSFSFNHSIKLPHFSLSGSFNILTKSVPSVSVSWYSRAAEMGALFTRPQIIGVGDAAQPELLLGEEKLKELLGDGRGPVFNVTVNGADDPEIWAARFMREAKQYARMA